MIILQIISYNLAIEAGPFDTGMITLQQPDNTEFTGRIWGDEFIFWADQKTDIVLFNQVMDGTIMPN